MSVLRDLAAGITPQNAVDRELLTYAVQMQMFCHRTGAVLDVRKAVYVGGKIRGKAIKSCVVTADVYDEVADQLAERAQQIGLELEVLDGRKLFPKGGGNSGR